MYRSLNYLHRHINLRKEGRTEGRKVEIKSRREGKVFLLYLQLFDEIHNYAI